MDTTEYYPSGEECTITHVWEERGKYTIRAKAIDEQQAESEWGTLQINVPKTKFLYMLFLRFLENHRHPFPLQQKIFSFQ